MFREEPHLKLVRADHIADEKVVCPIVASFIGLSGHRAGFLKYDFVSLEETGYLNRHFFPTARRTRDDGCFSDVSGHCKTDSAQELNSLSDHVHQGVLCIMMLIKEQMKLIRSMSRNLPMVLLVEVAKSHGIRQNLVQVLGAGRTHLFIQSNRQLRDFSVRLNFPSGLVQNRLCPFCSALNLTLPRTAFVGFSGHIASPPMFTDSRLRIVIPTTDSDDLKQSREVD